MGPSINAGCLSTQFQFVFVFFKKSTLFQDAQHGSQQVCYKQTGFPIISK